MLGSAIEIVSFEASMTDACEGILKALPEWFGIPASNEEYIRSLPRLTTFVARLGAPASMNALALLRCAENTATGPG
jgi:hypothetical protein